MTYSQIVSQTPVALIEFFASWCPHCQRMMPIVDKVKQQLEGKAPVYQFDIDQNKQMANDANVRSIPTFIIYKDGQEEWRHSGEMTENELLDKIKSYL